MTNPITTRREGAILEVTLNRPPANAIDLATSRIMGETFRAFRDDDGLRVAILRAEGAKFFCPGWDLKAAAAGDAVDGDYGVGGFGGLQELPNLNKPVIAAVNGICCGGGLELALSCDLILASDNATFALPEIRSGTVADAASIKLPKRIPYHVAMDLLLTGRWFDAEEALRWGILREVTAPEDLLAKAWDLAQLLASGPPLVYAAIKEVVREAENMRFQDALNRVTRRQMPTVDRLYSSEDQLEGARAFAEKRPPRLEGALKRPRPEAPPHDLQKRRMQPPRAVAQEHPGMDGLGQDRGVGHAPRMARGDEAEGDLLGQIRRPPARNQKPRHRRRLARGDRRLVQIGKGRAMRRCNRGGVIAEDIAVVRDLGELRGRCPDHEIAHLTQRDEMKIRVRAGREHHREIEPARLQIGAHLRRIVGLDVEPRIRQRAAKIREPIRKPAAREVVLDADPHRQRARPRPARAPQRLGPAEAERARMRLKPQPLGRELHARARAVEDARPECGLKRAHPARDGRLRHPQPLGRAVKAARLEQVEEGVEKVDLHRAP